jgi:hypothetical protein
MNTHKRLKNTSKRIELKNYLNDLSTKIIGLYYHNRKNYSRMPPVKGKIPNNIVDFTNLHKIIINNSQLTGQIPKNIGNLSKLKQISLHSNELTGQIPESITNLSNLKTLNLSNNQLTGQIPESITNLSNLKTLNLSNNQLTGQIPTNIDNLLNLEDLYLSNNQLTGEVPENIINLLKLKYLSLSGNHLHGGFPFGIIYQLNDYSIDFNQFNLGKIEGNLKKVRKLHYHFNKYNLNNDDINKYNLRDFINENTSDMDGIILAYIFSGGAEIFYDNLEKLETKYPNISDRFDDITNKLNERQSKIYPKIAHAMCTSDNLYFLFAHGVIQPDEYFFVPSNVSIILVNTPSYVATLKVKNEINSHHFIDSYYFENLLPGISFSSSEERNKTYIKKNQLRFFKSGDIINNVALNFKMEFPTLNKVYQGFIKPKNLFNSSYSNEGKQKNGTAQLNWHTKKGNISWPEITPRNHTTTLQKVVLKFIGKPKHYVLIVGSCQEGKLNNVRNKSLIYGQYELIKRKLACFQILSSKIEKNLQNNIKRLQNFSSTYKQKANCYIEFMSKLNKKIKNSNNNQKTALQLMYDQWKTRYDNMDIFRVEDLVGTLENLDDAREEELKHYYNNNAENKRQQRYNKRQQRYNAKMHPNTINNINSNVLRLMEGEVVGGGNYIKIKNHGTRKIRYYKNGKKYIIINGKKKKI